VASEGEIASRFRLLEPWLNEHMRRVWAAAESSALGRGGISLVARASGVSRRAIGVGLLELQQKPDRAGRVAGPVRRPGGGRKKAVSKDATLLRDLERLVEPVTRGDPESPLRWTCESLRRLAEELRHMGHPVSHVLVGELLHKLKYGLPAHRQTTEGSRHPDRNAQFAHINAQAEEFLKRGEPAISVDTNKKQQLGDSKNGGREWRPKGPPELVRVQDFAKQKDVPYGVYDPGQDTGWVSVGTDHDTAAFAVESIRRWWNTMGQASYPKARRLLIRPIAGVAQTGARQPAAPTAVDSRPRTASRSRLALRGRDRGRVRQRVGIRRSRRTVTLLTDDVFISMPPIPFEYEGRDVVASFCASIFGAGQRLDLVPTRANGQPAFGAYLRPVPASAMASASTSSRSPAIGSAR